MEKNSITLGDIILTVDEIKIKEVERRRRRETETREGRKTKIGFHFKDERFRIESSEKAFLEETTIPTDESDLLDIHLKLHAEKCKQRDVVAFTITVYEIENGIEKDKRGVSTIVHIV